MSEASAFVGCFGNIGRINSRSCGRPEGGQWTEDGTIRLALNRDLETECCEQYERDRFPLLDGRTCKLLQTGSRKIRGLPAREAASAVELLG